LFTFSFFLAIKKSNKKSTDKTKTEFVAELMANDSG
jgi:hypothetical protein